MPQEIFQKICKDAVPLEKIETWNTYYEKHSDRLDSLDKTGYTNQFSIVAPEVNSCLNEKVSIWKGDITKLQVDAIVNSANNSLLGGFGDGAIHRAAGESLLGECKILLGCPTGDAKITGGYSLPVKYVIHTVGPRDQDSTLLRSCYYKSLNLLVENNLKSVAFPCISTGAYGFPPDAAATVALKTVRDFLESNSSQVERVIFCLFLDDHVLIYEVMMQLYFPVK